MTGERKKINYQCLIDGRDLLEEITELQRKIENLKEDYYWEIYHEIQNRIINNLVIENGVKVIYSAPTA